MNILILTIIALVLIAAGYVVCRPKDHGEYEPICDFPEVTVSDNGVTVTVQMRGAMAAYMMHQAGMSFGIPSQEFAPKPDLSDHSEQRKKMIEEMMPPDYKKAYDLYCADMEAREAKGKLNL